MLTFEKVLEIFAHDFYLLYVNANSISNPLHLYNNVIRQYQKMLTGGISGHLIYRSVTLI